MAHALTETSIFTTSVIVPDGGDARTAASVEAPIQDVTDRTRNLHDRASALEALSLSTFKDLVNTFAVFNIGETGPRDNGERFAIVEKLDSSPSGNFTVSSDRITVPVPGTYMITVSGLASFTSGSGSFPGVKSVALRLDSTQVAYTAASVPSDEGLLQVNIVVV